MHPASLAAIALLSAAALAPQVVQAAERAEPVCIVTDLSGKAQTQKDRGIVDVGVLTQFLAGTRTRLQPGARMVVLYLKTGEQFALSGPGLIRFGAQSPSALNGAEPVRLRPVTGKDGTPIRIRLADVTQAAVVSRSGTARPIQVLGPSDAVTLESRPVFRWQAPETGLEYRFVLEDSEGATLFSRLTADDLLELPPEITLEAGGSYVWTLSARAETGTVYLSRRRLSVADEATRTAAENFRPAADATIAERVAYAVWLDEAGLRDEATAQWRGIAADGGPVPELRIAQQSDR
jgi:hypothetical protein